ncbi:hypothetical protein H0G86_004618 [Trichoderma simmonsii]|uniref:Secreted protein n=1 Tax=Trichoderma simmonsii TaxID=1491479 RepID=A0A8G0LCY6_9HYPO|nr:hypothetical protein H0G86_004618 [Trichoderma simmonsii]
MLSCLVSPLSSSFFFLLLLSLSASFAPGIETLFTSVAQALVRMSIPFLWLSKLVSNSISFFHRRIVQQIENYFYSILLASSIRPCRFPGRFQAGSVEGVGGSIRWKTT